MNFKKFLKKIKKAYLNDKKFLVGLLIVAVVVFFLQEYRYQNNGSLFRLSTQKDISQEDVKKPQESQDDNPELKEILESPIQDVRLKAARRLVERVDVDKALEILEKSTLPHTGEGHLVVHQIGFYAYQKYGVDSILKCRDYFLYACYHGAIIEAASDQGFDAIAKMTDKCKDSPTRHFQCVHAAGHSILAIWNYDLPEALKTCDEIYESDNKFPEALSSCHNGAFMENLFGVHDFDTGKQPKRDWLSDDPYFPCNAFGQKYQKGCWLNQAARIYQMQNGDLVKTTELCNQAGDNEYVAWCMDNVARQIHPLTNGDPSKTFSLCQQVGPNWYNNCVLINAGSFYSVGGKAQAVYICQNIPPQIKNECYTRIIGQILSDPIDKKEKNSLCQTIETPFKNQCLSALSSVN
ncbi:MAG: hypothetical protein ACD_30C00112G0074 [uncultured bacterium]|uniref:Uncharacterized protein n=3 Tax=Candidatus Daviesiibacteriota TaxID=1752718 RepID=A0A1F5K5D1_9BACT|nr:MAG: hypothetical protein ACD_30C00112G0074 [uncultured bacterium]KKQ14929.1 MAG: hypothetical protein US28_C0026G0007 [Candidatus Daviesbacteria bacterium GW2011_GWA1_36_8]OGE17233.1 MAG: hypothetical protein A2858_00825 [Candidatus Daviesbacteria bacterium RIFCSPHIGHO2_01_FULL_36_37]OGE36014.1 MAG: hypothetical protein A3E66_01820 [Candidatus Daviesbacteria bacterium RIFCSPHIGHO2_12_FULL_37_16]